MKFFDYIQMALMNLWRRKLRSFLTIAAVVIGAVSVLTMVTLVLTASAGVKQQLYSLGALRQVRVVPNPDTTESDFFSSGSGSTEGKKIDDEAIQKISKLHHVMAVSPNAYVWAFESVQLKGAEKKFEMSMNAFEPNLATNKTLSAGRNLEPGEKNAVVITASYVKRFGYDTVNAESLVGQTVVFTTRAGYTGIGVDVPEPPVTNNMDADAQNAYWEEQQKKTYQIEAEIVGVEANSIGLSDREIYITMDWARDLMTERRWEMDEEANRLRMEEAQARQQRFGGSPPAPVMKLVSQNRMDDEGYQSAVALVNDTANVLDVQQKVQGLGYGAITAEDFLANITKIMKLAGLVFGGIGSIALVVATLGIINTMVMAIFERTREIGVMRACGATRGVVRKLYTLEAAFIGFVGGFLGVGVLYGLVALGNAFGNDLLAAQQIQLQNVISPPLWLILGVVAFTTVLGALAGLYPAFRASRLDPVEALRYE